ncbi:MAG: hypothetical protein IJF73_00565 [Clostridia bacterium]|nr:hypothetical protein [Clostridia bacterium]
MENEALIGAITADDGTNDTSAIGGVETEPLTEGPEEEGLPEAEEAAKDGGEDDFAALAAADAAALAAVFPSRFSSGTLTALENPERYGELREAGLSPVEAYCASHYETLLAGRRQNTRSHLDSCAVRTARSGAERMSAADLSAARELFPSLTDTELEGLYRRARYGGR